MVSALIICSLLTNQAGSQQIGDPDFIRKVRTLSSFNRSIDADEVKAVLGEPDETSTRFDAGTAYQTWSFGTRGHTSFPKQGCVYFCNGEFTGGDRGWGVDSVGRIVSRKEMNWGVERLRSDSQGLQDPLWLIQRANELIPLGRDKALAIILEADRLAQAVNKGSYALLLRIILEVPQVGGFPDSVAPFPFSFKAGVNVDKTWPVLSQGDIPFIYPLWGIHSGRPHYIREDLETITDHRLRSSTLHPADDPFKALIDLMSGSDSPLDSIAEDGGKEPRSLSHDESLGYIEVTMLDQVLALVRTAYRPATRDRIRDARLRYRSELKRFHREFLALKPRWDASRQMYVRGDGTILAQKVRPAVIDSSLGPGLPLQ